MFRFGKRPPNASAAAESGPRVSTKLCTEKFTGKYPHVGLYDCAARKIWIAKPLSGQAIRTAHARLITGLDDDLSTRSAGAVSTVWKDRFLCFWFYTPRTGEGFIHNYPIDWEEAHLLVRVDPAWDYDRQRVIPKELEDSAADNLERQHKHGERIYSFYIESKLKYPFSLHFVGQSATDSMFYARRWAPPA
ncbi:MAG: hypothetical protein QOF78_3942 [Phycisphaerales bacterium]|jgi:hypothetical protein|nr:hypothetical protein [Phycisphaerales bacterium]